MTKAKAVKKKQKNPIWGKIWREVKFFLLSLFSNDACVEGRHKKWYFPVSVAILSCVLAVVPTMATYFSKSGGSFLDAPQYDYEIGLTSFTKAIAEKNLPFKISEEGILLVDGNNKDNNEKAFKDALKTTVTNSTGENQTLDYFANVYKTTEVKLTAKEGETGTDSSSVTPTIPTYIEKYAINFAAYVIGNETNPTTFVTSILLKGDDPNKEAFGENIESYQTNFIVFGTEGFYAAKKPSGTTSNPKSAIYCTYKNSGLLGKSLSALASEDLYGNVYQDKKISESEYRAEVVNSWKQVFAAGWDETRITLGWQYTGIGFAINVGVTFLLGLMVFLMTRGKNNPFRTYTFWDGQKIAYFASFCPALLSLLGFIPMFQTLGMFLFMLLFGLRIMWMSTKSLRPYQN